MSNFIYAESTRLIYRQLQDSDVEGMFELDSDPEVHRYLGNNPIKEKKEAAEIIRFVRKQYNELGIGRWAIIEKESMEFVGWGGLKKVTESGFIEAPYLDLGYRLIRRFWGKGYASENAFASIAYAKNELAAKTLFASAHKENKASNCILTKIGMRQIGDGYYENEPIWYYKLSC